MKTKTAPTPARTLPSEAEIREYAHHLYVMSGWLPGRDLDNWLEAEAHLTAMMASRSAPPKPARRRPVPAQPTTV